MSTHGNSYSYEGFIFYVIHTYPFGLEVSHIHSCDNSMGRCSGIHHELIPFIDHVIANVRAALAQEQSRAGSA